MSEQRRATGGSAQELTRAGRWRSPAELGLALCLLALPRLLFLPLNAGIDIENHWRPWLRELDRYGFSRLYLDSTFNYGPLYAYVMALIAVVDGWLEPVFGEELAQVLLLKLPPLLAEAGLFWLLYRYVGRYGSREVALICVLAFGLMPGIVLDSVVWAQTDGLLTLFAFGCLVALARRRVALAAALFAAGLALKPQIVIVAPVVLGLGLRQLTPRTLVAAVGGFVGAWLGISAFFVATGQTAGMLYWYAEATGRYPVLSSHALNGWFLVQAFSGIRFDATPLGPIALKSLGSLLYGAFALSVAWAVYRWWRSEREDGDVPFVAFAAGVATFGFYMLPTEMHERYLYPAFFFLALCLPLALPWVRITYCALSATFTVGMLFAIAVETSHNPGAGPLPDQPWYWPLIVATLVGSLVNLVLLAQTWFALQGWLAVFVPATAPPPESRGGDLAAPTGPLQS
ncbi:MAG: DUF2029 domain-containing protein [Chloroflexi bacterium]|nr:DUF2029 domain-containing protein [Chloroflexota bacterium]